MTTGYPTPANILVALYDRTQLPVFKERLEESGFTDVHFCTRSEEVRKLIHQYSFDLAVIDTELQGKETGIQTARFIKKRTDIPLILLVPYPDNGLLDSIRKLEVFGVFPKPVNWHQLSLNVESALKYRQNIQKAEDMAEYRLYYEKVPLAYQSLDKNGKILIVNPAWEELTGYEMNEVKSKWFGDLLEKEEDREHFQKNFKYFRMTGKAMDIGYTIRRKDGSLVLTSMDGTVSYDEKGNYSRSHCILKDITEQKLLEKKIKEQYDLLESVTSVPTHLIYVFDVKEQKNKWVNKTLGKLCKEITGKDPLNAGLEDILSLVHPGDHDMLTKSREAYENLEDLQPLEYRLKDPKAGWRWYRDHKSVLDYDPDGSIRTIVGIAVDCTVEKETREELDDERFKLKEYFENLPMMVYNVSFDGIIIDCNNTAIRTLGYANKEQLIGKNPIESIYAPESREKAAQLLEKWKKEKKLINEELKVITRNGKVLDILLNVDTVYNRNGDPLHSLSTHLDITELKRHEQRIHEQERRWLTLLDNIPGMTYQCLEDEYWTMLFLSKGCREITGYDPEDIMHNAKQNYNEIIHPEDRERITREVLKARGSRFEFIYRIVTKGGDKKWVMERGRRTGRQVGNKHVLEGVIVDINERVMAEQELELRNRFIEIILDNLPIGLAVNYIDKGETTYINKKFEEIYGWPAEELKNIPEFFEKVYPDPEYREAAMNRVLQDIESGDPARMIWEGMEVTAKDGRKRIISAKNIPLFDQNLMISTVLDVTEQKQTERKLKESEIRFRELFNRMSSGVAVYRYDTEKDDFLIEDINQSGLQLSKLSKKEETVGHWLSERFPGVRDLGLWEVLKKVHKTGKASFLPSRKYKDHRIEQYVENHVFKLPSGEVVAVYDDVTKREQTVRDLEASYRDVRNLASHIESVREEERKQVAMELHDDLGQILTAIKMDLSWINRKLPENNESLKDRSRSSIKIVDQAISAVQKLTAELRPVILDDLGLLETVKSYVKHYQKRSKIRINLKLPEKEPDIKLDKKLSVYRIIQEALTNTARHANADRVDLKLKMDGSKITILIHDNGIGIPGDKLKSPESFGIMNMRERVLRWDGEIIIVEENGTRIDVTM